MPSFNKVILMGNLTRDPEMRYTNTNMAVANIGLAVNERWKNKQTDQWEDRVNFIDCEAWGRTAENISQYFQKGKPILIEGKLRLDQWQDQQGNNRSKLKVVIDRWEFVGGRDEGGGGGGGYGGQRGAPAGRPQQNDGPPPDQPGPHEAMDDGDIPF